MMIMMNIDNNDEKGTLTPTLSYHPACDHDDDDNTTRLRTVSFILSLLYVVI